MPDRLRSFLIILAVLFLPVAGMASSISDPSETPILIGSIDVHTPCLSRQQARNIFSYRTKNWPDMRKIKLVSYGTDTASFSQFVESSLNYRPYQLERTWQKLHNLGGTTAPVVVQSAQEMVSMIEEMSGAIGYVSLADLPLVKRHKVRVLSLMMDNEAQRCESAWEKLKELGDIPLYLVEHADGC